MNNALAGLLAALTIAGATLGGTTAASTSSATSPYAGGRVSNAPVLFVHGFVFSLCPGGKTPGTWASAESVMKSRGYTGPMQTIDYYACDSGGANIQSSGDPNAYFPSGANSGLFGGLKGGNTDSTDIRHISYQLAWYIYNNYSSKGQTVELVAHSMGGLIVNWMLYQEQAQNALFPPYLYVQDAVTISTPYAGVNDGYNNVTWCPSNYEQCAELLPGSDFINELQASGLAAQATGGTDWTAIGGSACDTVDAPDGTTLATGDVHKVWYYAAKADEPVCYSHTSYLTDTSTALDMPLKFRNPGDADWTTTTGEHSLAAMADAVMSEAN